MAAVNPLVSGLNPANIFKPNTFTRVGVVGSLKHPIATCFVNNENGFLIGVYCIILLYFPCYGSFCFSLESFQIKKIELWCRGSELQIISCSNSSLLECLLAVQ